MMDTIGRQLRHLQFSGPEETDPVSRFRIAVTLCLGGAVADDSHKILEAGLAMLEAECNAPRSCRMAVMQAAAPAS